MSVNDLTISINDTTLHGVSLENEHHDHHLLNCKKSFLFIKNLKSGNQIQDVDLSDDYMSILYPYPHSHSLSSKSEQEQNMILFIVIVTLALFVGISYFSKFVDIPTYTTVEVPVTS